MEKRTDETMMKLILHVAEQDERIRAAVMNGSRANPKVKPDEYADYDVVYYVENLPAFTADHAWVNVFGERLIMQMPEDKVLPPPDRNGRFPYLMQFTDGNRIDLTLVSAGDIPLPEDTDSLTVVLLDKDGRLGRLRSPSDHDYRVHRPSQKQFEDVINEFWWVALYTSKGLGRREILYAKGTLEGPVRTAFMQMLRWYAGTCTNFEANTGAFDKWLPLYLEKDLWDSVLKTYSNAEHDAIWKSLIRMAAIFTDVSERTGKALGYAASFEGPEVYRELMKQKQQQEVAQDIGKHTT
ncbi:aminoglycoside adenylyltransferase [Alteribacter lacisalsi]|uniref:Aminoglycoside adenylyltransferase n=1 Tax=Alteribacter lacisalsi TaxID=2045244 RepID=A0A2W0HKS5_9BACI|nr:aminoglycoside 6-adenylyltransferase [Alteribacter lacisalsi]PYZ97702.1 aminoglycoside adenylyltransferase [Alteribacter lacisalsi]